MSGAAGGDLRALVDEIKDERGDTDDYLILDDVLKRLPAIAEQADSDVASALRRVKERLGRTPYAPAHIDNIAAELGVEL